ncbi:hypothetical protein [Paracoccus simplex]|uniref:Phage tail tape measure protein n=1 Tax=Paracoccus simplex TaxID=2086346 RepID=A0ABV7S0H7_9RHOB
MPVTMVSINRLIQDFRAGVEAGVEAGSKAAADAMKTTGAVSGAGRWSVRLKGDAG